MSKIRLWAVLAAILLLAGGCKVPGVPDGNTVPPLIATSLAPIRLQLPAAERAQFAGYIAAEALGFYRLQGLDVQLIEGGPDVSAPETLIRDTADYAVSWMPAALATRERGDLITDVAQFFTRPATYQVALKSSGITTPAQLKGKRVGAWTGGDDDDLLAGLTKAGLRPGRDVHLVPQQGVRDLLDHKVDSMQAMSYQEYAQLLQSIDPATGKAYTPSDFSVIDWARNGTAMLEDGVWASQERLHDAGFRAQTVQFLIATIKGWAYCRDYPDRCADLIVKQHPGLDRSLQRYQMNQVNQLLWPAPAGLGLIDDKQWQQSVTVARHTRTRTGRLLLSGPPKWPAYFNLYAESAVGQLKQQGFDPYGITFQPTTPQL